jgi:hypothetical protein
VPVNGNIPCKLVLVLSYLISSVLLYRLSIRLNEFEKKHMLQFGIESPKAYRAW